MSTNFTRSSDTIMLVAHRGGAGLAPENTLAAFKVGLEQGADAVELDVHMSRDGVPVVIHDPLLARTTNVPGVVADLSVEELKTLNAAARYFGPGLWNFQGIPTLDEVLELVKGRAKIQVEIKLNADGLRYPGIEAGVIDALNRHGMLYETIILSFDFTTLQTIKALNPALKTCALIGTRYLSRIGACGPSAVAEELANLGMDYVGVDERWMSTDLYVALRKRGLNIGVWTVNDEERMRHFSAMGVDFITSDRPDILQRVLKR